ncbi:dTDP-4-dehydrorhamnose reductase [Citromicrobium sp. JLT1363]|uniref:dTDP-4-dehydrorhamnose reductase n=1 Tax=Citromicrobium sp. JLT1363 TaxID=517722 RepID=UPI000225DF88|nr:dTDP-4-dehydrorhamnose reductase [Citromicrobium sp. JLT1363]
MKILVTGREGQVARSLAERGSAHELVFAARPDFDLADAGSIARTIENARPDLVISAAAYTAVDQAEDEPELAMAINGEAPGHIGRAAASVGAPVVHLSTDYVFDGSGEHAWREEDPTGPIGVYGRTKLAGEQALAASGGAHAILRTAWVYSPFGNNFVKTMLRLAESRDALNVVKDQYGNPTSALDIADALLAVADRWQDAPGHGTNAVYHFAGTGSTNWADFARAIFDSSRKRGGPTCEVTGIPSSDYPTKAQRPANSRLDSAKFADTFGHAAPRWQESLDATVARLVG